MEVIEISNSDEPDSPRFTRMNQGLVKFSISSLETGQEVIEIMSSDAEDVPQSLHSPIQTSPPPGIPQMSPGRLRQPSQIGGSPNDDFPDLTHIPPQGSFSSSPQLPDVSSSEETENMMDIDDVIHHSPPPPLPLPQPPLPLPIPQINLAVDAIERRLSNVTVSPIPSHSTHLPHASEFVEDSEPEIGLPTEVTHDRGASQVTPTPPMENTTVHSAESDNDSLPPPPPSSSSPSYHMPLSSHPTPTVRCLLYGGPHGIFKDANTSIVQHIQTTLPQKPISSPSSPPPDVHLDEESEVGLPSTIDAVTPPMPDYPNRAAIAQVNDPILLSLTFVSPPSGAYGPCHN